MKRSYTCDYCGKTGKWGKGWVWYGSWKDFERSGEVVEIRCPDCSKGVEVLDA